MIYIHPLYPTKVIAYNCNLLFENSCSICWLFDHRTLVNHRCLGWWSTRIFGHFLCLETTNQLCLYQQSFTPMSIMWMNMDQFISHKTFGFVEGKSHRVSQSFFQTCLFYDLQLSFQTDRTNIWAYLGSFRSTSKKRSWWLFFWRFIPQEMVVFSWHLGPRCARTSRWWGPFWMGFPKIWGCDIHKKWLGIDDGSPRTSRSGWLDHDLSIFI